MFVYILCNHDVCVLVTSWCLPESYGMDGMCHAHLLHIICYWFVETH